MKTIPWDLRFGLASNGGRGAYFPPLPLPVRPRKMSPPLRNFRWTAAMQHRTRLILRRLLLALTVLIVVGMGILMHMPLTEPVFLRYRIPHIDKIVHFSLYFILSSTLCAWLWLGRVPMLKQIVLVLVLLMGYSALEEWTQQWSPGRTSDFYDWLADASGFTLGSITVWCIIAFGPRTLRVTE
jgi:VanZ family protein